MDRKRIAVFLLLGLVFIGFLLMMFLLHGSHGEPSYDQECDGACKEPFYCLDVPGGRSCLCPLGQFHDADVGGCFNRNRSYCELCQGRLLMNYTVCLGYFANSSNLPWCPTEMDVQFYLYTGRNKNVEQRIQVYDDTIATSHFNASLPTKFLIHGLGGTSKQSWSQKIKTSLFDTQGQMNIVDVDWRIGAAPAYLQAATNTWSAGVAVARIMDAMHGPFLENVHCIGYSLGAHVCGFAGKEIRRMNSSSLLGRITDLYEEHEAFGTPVGLDPAGPEFESNGADHRLDSRDALLVDVIHTDAVPGGKCWGIQKPIGHVDYYVNGGYSQPGCQGSSPCSHRRSHALYFYSIDAWNLNASLYQDACLIMGYHMSSTCRGDYHITTERRPPYRPLSIIE